jgi:glucose/arabinose dehydrogenase
MRYLLSIIVFAVLLIAACKSKITSELNPVANTAVASNQKINKAEANYAKYCASCHGEKMNAFVDRVWKHGNKPSDLYASIKNGAVVDGMPSFEATFTHEELEDLVAYIQNGIANREKFDFKEKLASNIIKTDDYTVRIDTMVYGIEVPWGMAFDDEGNIYYTERKGTVSVRKYNGATKPLSGYPEAKAYGQGGMMDIELDPDFNKNKIVYISYTKLKKTSNEELYTTAINKYVLVGEQLTQGKEIFEAQPYVNTRYHFGCRLEFDKNGYLFISLGDRGKEKDHPQFLTNAHGKIHRINSDGSIPKDNPYLGINGAMPSIYSIGHRNPQGIAIDPETNILWETEHGPRGGDEVNLVRPGKNYGWPTISYGINYNGTTFTNITAKDGLEQPVVYWLPSIAPSGTAMVRGDKFPKWKGDLLVGSLRFNYLHRCDIQGDKIVKEEIMLKNIGRMRDVQIGKDGYIYVAVENPGAIYRVVPVSL